MSMPTPLPSSLGSGVERMRSRRGLVIVFGVVLALLGLAALALDVTATIASVLVIGVLMIVAGAVEVVIGFRTRDWGRLFLFELAGLAYMVAGAFALTNPVLASAALTLMLGAGLVATGVLRLVAAYRMGQAPMRPALVASGLVTLLLGFVIVSGWPANGLFVIGMLIGIDLLFHGAGWIAFGMRLGQHRP